MHPLELVEVARDGCHAGQVGQGLRHVRSDGVEEGKRVGAYKLDLVSGAPGIKQFGADSNGKVCTCHVVASPVDSAPDDRSHAAIALAIFKPPGPEGSMGFA